MLRFTTSGNHYDRGVQQGRACRELALPWFQARLGEMSKSREDVVQRWVEGMQRSYPDGIEESRGIARGLGMEESAYFRVVHGFLIGVPQCTTCGVRDEHSHPLLAKTDDLLPEEVGKNVLETTIPDRGYQHVHFHFAASIWTVAGLNERGLAIAMTGIPGPTLDQDGIPSLISLHTILPACATVPETLTHLRNLRINRYGFSLLIGDAAGDMALVEKTGVGMTVTRSDDGAPLLHTNHILDPHFAAQNPPQSEPVLSNGRHRFENVCLITKRLPRSEVGLRELVRDRASVGAICQQGEDNMHTDFAVILNPVGKQMTIFPGCPTRVAPEIITITPNENCPP